MILIVCLDDQNGMMFNNRRQSMDKCVRERICALCSGSIIWMNGYSAGQFSEIPSNFQISEDFLRQAGSGEYCFVENEDVLCVEDRVEGIVVFWWNRRYPADMKFPVSAFSDRWRLVETTEFSGNSHEKITQEVYML